MHHNEYSNDTIVALCSAAGRSGVGLIRISGPDAVKIIRSIFKTGNTTDLEFVDRRATYGHLIDPETMGLIDDGIAVVMRGPASYTGEDVVELSLHGSPVILQTAIRIIMSLGARLAQRGEFTRRAFLSGRMDLIQAEAVIDLIDAETFSQASDARLRIDRRLSDEIFAFSSELRDVGAEIEAFMDFDDDEEGVPPDPLHCVARIFDQIGMLLKSSRSGRFRSKGLTAVIAGKPNVGKSTLFNALLGTNRMIISPQPGTTRDPVSEKVFINGVAISLGDTAGIRDQPDSIEREGINRTLEWIDNSDIAIVVIDSTQAPDNDDLTVLERVGDKPGIVVLNKIDRGHDDVMLELEGMKSGDVVRISARTGEGLKLLSARIADLADSIQQSWEFSERGSLNDRALLLMESAHVNLGNAIQLLAGKQALELVSFEIKSACDKIDEITGRKFTEDVLDRIFERFCVGK